MNKKIVLALSCIALSFGVSAQATGESNWYMGSHYSVQEVSSRPDRALETLGFIGGYKINKYIGLETRYSEGISGHSDSFYANDSLASYKEDIDSQASLLIKASYPLSRSFDIYALAGLVKSNYEITTSSSYTDLEGNTTTTYPHLIRFSENGFNYGMGVNYRVTNKVALFIEHQNLPDLAIGSGSSNHWKSTNLGINYAF